MIKESLPCRMKSEEALSPKRMEKASIRIDLPAPVSPVKMVMPSVKGMVICSMRAKLRMPICLSIIYSFIKSAIRLRTLSTSSTERQIKSIVSSPAKVPMTSDHLA